MKYSRISKKWLTALLCLFCSIPVITSAAIKSPTAERTVKVTVADLNLVDEQGVAELYRRLQRASRTVCGPTNFSAAGSLKQLQLNQQCYRETLKSAVQDFGNTNLQRLHADSKRLP